MRTVVALFAALTLSVSSALFGQTTNNQSLSGTVQDSSGAVVPNATVTVVSEGTNLTRSAVSSESGAYFISNLPLGFYNVSATAAGFKKYQVSHFEITVGQQAALNVTLDVGNVNESVTVQADAVHVDTTSGEVSNLITGTQASQIQLNGRNFPQLLQLLPGVSTTYNSGFSLFGGYGVNNSGQSINGSRTDTFSWYLDGADNKDNGGGGNNFVNINPDAIAEFRVLTSNYSAQYGGSAGAVINIAVKGGTTDFHGVAYEFFRNDAIQARAFNSLTIPELRFNNFGWNLGGPVWIPGLVKKNSNKLFFFVGEDFKRLRQGATNTWVVPSLAQRSGNFSALPQSQWPVDPLTRVPYAGGIVPSGLWNSNSTKLLNIYPKPNSGTTGFIFNTVAPLNTNQYLFKVDYNISNRNQLSVHYFRDYYSSLQNLTQTILYNRNIPNTNSSIQWTFVPNASTVNVAQFTFTGNVIREKTGIGPNPIFLTDYTRAGQGLTYPTIYNASSAIPSLQVAGFTNLTSTALNFDNFNRIFDWKDDFSKIMGSHNFKAGILIMRSRKNQDNVPAINGTFVFNTTSRPLGLTNTTGNAVADTLLGNFYSYTEASGTREGWYRFSQIEPYVEDDWKVNSRLTLNLGLRWAYMQPQYSTLNNTTAFLPQYYNPAQAVRINPSTGAIVANSGNIYNGLALGGTSFPQAAIDRIPVTKDPAVQALFRGLPKGTANTDWNTWQPRIGFAYDLTGNQSTVLRGGYGMFYERIEGNFIFSAVNNPPFVQQSLIYYGNTTNPGGGALQNFPSTINNSHYLDMRVPRTMNWSLSLEHKFGGNTLLSLGYVGSSASNLSYQQDANQLLPGTLQKNPGVNVNALRPYLGYADIFQYNTGGNFIYNSLQVQFRKQFTQGGLINVAYTWSKARTDANSYNYQPQNSYNLRGDWGPSSYNRNHIFVTSYVYPLPFWLHGQNFLEKALGGWQMSGVVTLQTGLPLNMVISSDQAGIGYSSTGASYGGQRPNLVLADAAPVTGAARTQVFNPLAFALPGAGQFGNLGAYALWYPFYSNWDVSMSKAFPIGEKVSASLRAELYNFPNHFSYTTISNVLGSSNFGQATAATDPRTLQLALKLSF